jgi:hypothetical protein
MTDFRGKWTSRLLIAVCVAMISASLHARDPGFNQPGAIGGMPGGGAPGVGAWDPGINQPGAIGNTGPARRSVRR